MYKPKFLLLTIGTIFLVLLVFIAWINKGHVTGYVRDVSINYTVRTISVTHNGLCSTEKVKRKDGAHLVTLRVCEDTILSITENDEWLIITTGRSTYQKNKIGSEDVITGFGGVSLVR